MFYVYINVKDEHTILMHNILDYYTADPTVRACLANFFSCIIYDLMLVYHNIINQPSAYVEDSPAKKRKKKRKLL